MKKILSMLLIVAMLLSMVLVVIPASAADEVPAGYTPIENLDNLAAGGKYYLTKDITVNGRKGIGHNVVLDGGGHTITYTGTGALFGWAKDITVRNLNMVGTINESNSAGYNAGGALTNGFEASALVENCTFDVDITVSGNFNFVGGVFSKNETGNATVTFRNVVNNGDITVNGKVTDGIGGIMGWSGAGKTIFDNCTYGGTITVNHTGDATAHVGGIIGKLNNNVELVGCQNNGKIKVETANLAFVGGIVGSVLTATTVKDCVNSGTIELAKTANNKNNGVGGIIGQISTEDKSGLTITAEGCLNMGEVKSAAEAPASHVGGIIGKISAVSKVDTKHCVNFGKVSTGSGDGWGSTGGIVGTIMTVASSWHWSNVTGGDFDFTNCHNYGEVVGKDAGGILGTTRQLYNNDITLDFTNCSNFGAIKGTWEWAGGIAAFLCKEDKAPEGITIVFKNCANIGDVYAQWEAAGIVARVEGNGNKVVTFDTCANVGDISSGGGVEKTAGIVRQAYIPSEIKNCANASTETTRYPIAPPANYGGMNATVTASDNVYVAKEADNENSGAHGTQVEANAIISVVYEKLNSFDAYAAKLNPVYDRVVAYVEYVQGFDSSKFSDKSWGRVEEYLSAGEAIASGTLSAIEAAVMDTTFNGLTEAMGNLYLKGQDTYIELYDAIEAAEEALAGKKLSTGYRNYADEVIAEAKLIVLNGVTDENTIDGIIAELAKVVKVMGDEDYYAAVNTVYVRTAEEFALLDGFSGIAVLENDITITAPLKSFKGELYGRGHAIYTDGAVFESLENAIIDGVVIIGGDIEADSLFGTVKVYVHVDEVTVLVNSINSAVLFSNLEAGTADNLAEIDIEYSTIVVTGAVNGVAGLVAAAEENTYIDIDNVMFNGKVNGKAGLVGDSLGEVDIYGAVVYATVKGTDTAAGIIASAADLYLEAIYFEGVVDAANAVAIADISDMEENAAEIVDCFAYAVNADGSVAEGVDLEAVYSGAAAYCINEAFSDIIFVQIIGIDAKPTMGTPDYVYSNVVNYNAQEGKYYNWTSEYVQDEITPEFVAPSAPMAPVVDTLNDVIAMAEAVDLDRYTADSKAGFDDALAAAIAARKALDQKAIDEAQAVLLSAIAALRVPVPADTAVAGDATALNAAIAAAEALKAEDYTAESWAAMQAVLVHAKATTTGTQALIDNAKAALDKVVAGLVKYTAPAPVAVDYTKINASIATAEALVATDYTEGTWATMQAMLALAKSATAGGSQDAVNQAQTALDRAVAGLAAAPVEEDGCNSVIGGTAVVLAAVIALGAGVSFKKKED